MMALFYASIHLWSYGLMLNSSYFQHLAPKDHGRGKCRAACLKSLRMLGLDYLDLYLIHWPGASGMRPEDTRHEALRMESWRDLEQLYDEGMQTRHYNCDYDLLVYVSYIIICVSLNPMLSELI